MNDWLNLGPDTERAETDGASCLSCGLFQCEDCARGLYPYGCCCGRVTGPVDEPEFSYDPYDRDITDSG